MKKKGIINRTYIDELQKSCEDPDCKSTKALLKSVKLKDGEIVEVTLRLC